MVAAIAISAQQIKAARQDDPKMRDRDFAEKLGISEGQLVAAHVGETATRITADMDRLMPAVTRLGEVMALTRNESCVIEKVGVYDNYRGGEHACLIVNDEIDLRMFPSRWVYGFAIEHETDKGMRRTIQIFDAAGDAVHKIFMREGSNVDAWAGVVEELRLEGDELTLTHRPARGQTQTWDCNIYWARAEMHVQGGPVPHYVTLSGNGRTVEIGRFLSEDERKALYGELSDFLKNA